MLRSGESMSSSTVLLFAGAVFGIVAAVLGAYGFTGRALVIGVDLGTTFSAIAYAARKGQPIVAPGMDGTASLASIIAVSGGTFVVGRDAEASVTDEPWSAVFDAKRVIGRRLDDPVTIVERHRHGGRIVPHPNAFRNHFGKRVPASKLSTCAGCASDVAFVVRAPPGEDISLANLAHHQCVDEGSLMSVASLRRAAAEGAFELPARLAPGSADGDNAALPLLLLTPQAVGCILITALLERVRTAAGHATLTASVAAVPADFSPSQREATREAYARAGVTISRMQFEPAAAATAYGLHTRPDVGAVLVFDMGGGTTDVSVLYLQDGAFTVIGSAGDGHLGGEDFDDCLLRVIGSQLRSIAGSSAGKYDVAALTSVANEVMLAAADDNNSDDGAASAPISLKRPAAPTHALCGLAWLKHEAERVKIALSRDGTSGAPVAANWWCMTETARNVTSTITRDEFEGSCDPLFRRTLEPVRTALSNANVAADEVDEVVLVGGSSRLPRVRDLLRDFLRRRDGLRHTVDPDLAVAIGAALVID